MRTSKIRLEIRLVANNKLCYDALVLQFSVKFDRYESDFIAGCGEDRAKIFDCRGK